MPDVLCLGEALVDLISSSPGKSIRDSSVFHVAPGGAVCNVAVGLARLGVSVGLITKVGVDPFGQMMLDFLKKESVDTLLIKTTDQHLTALVFVALDEDKKPAFFFYGTPGADRSLEPEDINEKDFEGVKVFHLGTISLSLEPVRSATLKALELARKAGALISFDPNLRFHLWHDRELLIKYAWLVLPQSDLVKVNEEELEFLTYTKDLEKGAELLIENGVKMLLVTLGPRGAFFATKYYQGTVPGFKFEPLDTTGAGDAFAAGMIAWMLKFKSIPPEKVDMIKAVSFVNAFAGLSTTKIGAIEGLVIWREVEEYLAAIKKPTPSLDGRGQRGG
jgi:fructokinase